MKERGLATVVPASPELLDETDDPPFLPGWMDAVLSRLYDGVLAPAGFQRFIEELVEAFECKGAILYTAHLESQAHKAMWMTGIDEAWLHRYAMEFSREDIFARHLLKTRSRVFQATNLHLPHDEGFPQSRFFRECLLPQDIVCAAGVVVAEDEGWITQLIVQRSSAQRPFTLDDLKQANRLLPHLRRALQARQRLTELEQDHGLLAGSLDVLAIPTVLVDEDNGVSYANRNALALLQDEDAPIRIEHGRLIAREREANLLLHYEIGAATQVSRGESAELEEVVRMPRPGRLPLSLLITPHRPPGDQARRQGAALIFLFDPENLPRLSTERARKSFGLSNAEAILAAELCHGASLEEVATQRGVSAHTIRTQLKSLFMKTGTNRQTELVALLLASPAYFVAG